MLDEEGRQQFEVRQQFEESLEKKYPTIHDVDIDVLLLILDMWEQRKLTRHEIQGLGEFWTEVGDAADAFEEEWDNYYADGAITDHPRGIVVTTLSDWSFLYLHHWCRGDIPAFRQFVEQPYTNPAGPWNWDVSPVAASEDEAWEIEKMEA